MTYQLKALVAVLAVGIAQILLVSYGHMSGWPETINSSILYAGLALYVAIFVWSVRRARARQAQSSANSKVRVV